MNKLSALEKFIEQLRGIPSMQLKTVAKRGGEQLMKTGKAIGANPRAALGGGILGAGAAAYGMQDEPELTEEELMELLSQQEPRKEKYGGYV